MLVLTRKVAEGIVIADTIEVVVLNVKDGQVRLGIAAPRDIPILRKELLSPKAACNSQAPKKTQTAIGLEGEVK